MKKNNIILLTLIVLSITQNNIVAQVSGNNGEGAYTNQQQTALNRHIDQFFTNLTQYIQKEIKNHPNLGFSCAGGTKKPQNLILSFQNPNYKKGLMGSGKECFVYTKSGQGYGYAFLANLKNYIQQDEIGKHNGILKSGYIGRGLKPLEDKYIIFEFNNPEYNQRLMGSGEKFVVYSIPVEKIITITTIDKEGKENVKIQSIDPEETCIAGQPQEKPCFANGQPLTKEQMKAAKEAKANNKEVVKTQCIYYDAKPVNKYTTKSSNVVKTQCIYSK